MSDDFTVKDSGVREEYASGMRRDTQDGKPDYTLIDRDGLRRYAQHLTLGAEKYGRDNWRLANSQEELDRFRSSAMRHFMQWLNGDRDEDHASAVKFNLDAAEYVAKRLDVATEPAKAVLPQRFHVQYFTENALPWMVSDHLGIVPETYCATRDIALMRQAQLNAQYEAANE